MLFIHQQRVKANFVRRCLVVVLLAIVQLLAHATCHVIGVLSVGICNKQLWIMGIILVI